MRQIMFTLLFFLSTILVNPSIVAAHPGKTATDGCHYCRTNCDTWGVPCDERHCLEGAMKQINPTSVPLGFRQKVSVNQTRLFKQ